MRSLMFCLAGCLAAGLAPLVAHPPPLAGGPLPVWPETFEGRALKPLPLTAAETRAARDFPGAIARFSDGRRAVVLRLARRPSRQLHAAETCFRGAGYRVLPGPLTRDQEGVWWNTFTATRDGEQLAVRTLIKDAQGQTWQDVSSWFWAAIRNRSAGPWLAITVAEPAPASPSPVRPAPAPDEQTDTPGD